MNQSDMEIILYTKKVDLVFIVIGYLVNGSGIFSNSLFIYLIKYRTPKSLTSFSMLLLNFALCDFFSSLAGFLALQKTVFSGCALTYIFHGICGWISPEFCYFLHVFVCHCFAHSQWILMISFIYRYYILGQHLPDPRRIVKLSLLVYIPSFVFLIVYMSDAAKPGDLRNLIYSHHPKYHYNLPAIWGELTIAGNMSIWSISTFGAIIYMTIPCFPIYLVIIIFRYKTLNILNSKERILMSENTRQSHKQLIKALTIQAMVPIFWLTAATFYLLLLFQIVQGAILENMLFRIMEFMPMITPLISMYFVQPYRLQIKSWIPKRREKPKPIMV